MPQDLRKHVDISTEDDPLVNHLCGDGETTLALLFLLALCLRSQSNISNLAELTKRLPDDLLAYIKPQHVVQYIHTHLPRSNQKADSFIIFGFDEVNICLLICLCLFQYACQHCHFAQKSDPRLGVSKP